MTMLIGILDMTLSNYENMKPCSKSNVIECYEDVELRFHSWSIRHYQWGDARQ